MGIFQTDLSRDMGPDLNRRAIEACFQPSTQHRLLYLRHAGLTTLPAVKGKGIPAILTVALIPALDRVVVQVEKLCNPSAVRAIV